MKYRILVLEDGFGKPYYRPQYKGWLLWYNFLCGVCAGPYASVREGAEDYFDIVEYDDLQYAANHILQHRTESNCRARMFVRTISVMPVADD
jgi:hypothetical protein